MPCHRVMMAVLLLNGRHDSGQWQETGREGNMMATTNVDGMRQSGLLNFCPSPQVWQLRVISSNLVCWRPSALKRSAIGQLAVILTNFMTSDTP